jgi:hypothetical protein
MGKGERMAVTGIELAMGFDAEMHQHPLLLQVVCPIAFCQGVIEFLKIKEAFMDMDTAVIRIGKARSVGVLDVTTV